MRTADALHDQLGVQLVASLIAESYADRIFAPEGARITNSAWHAVLQLVSLDETYAIVLAENGPWQGKVLFAISLRPYKQDYVFFITPTHHTDGMYTDPCYMVPRLVSCDREISRLAVAASRRVWAKYTDGMRTHPWLLMRGPARGDIDAWFRKDEKLILAQPDRTMPITVVRRGFAVAVPAHVPAPGPVGLMAQGPGRIDQGQNRDEGSAQGEEDKRAKVREVAEKMERVRQLRGQDQTQMTAEQRETNKAILMELTRDIHSMLPLLRVWFQEDAESERRQQQAWLQQQAALRSQQPQVALRQQQASQQQQVTQQQVLQQRAPQQQQV
jgi:hypothetical protein